MQDKDSQLIAEKYVDMFSKEFEDEQKLRMVEVYRSVFALQDQYAKESEIFKRILNSEIKDAKTPEERYNLTNAPKSKTRNAMLLKHIYKNKDEWEQELLTNPFYKI